MKPRFGEGKRSGQVRKGGRAHCCLRLLVTYSVGRSSGQVRSAGRSPFLFASSQPTPSTTDLVLYRRYSTRLLRDRHRIPAHTQSRVGRVRAKPALVGMMALEVMDASATRCRMDGSRARSQGARKTVGPSRVSYLYLCMAVCTKVSCKIGPGVLGPRLPLHLRSRSIEF